MAANSSVDGEKFLRFFLTAYGVKCLPRTGWMRNGINGTQVEHVGDHMWGMALMSIILLSDRKDIDVLRTVKLCIVHDLAETLVGDITPYCGVSKHEKARLEQEAIEKIAKLLPESVGPLLLELFEEFEDHNSPEAIVAHRIDKLDMVVQAKFYEKNNPELDLSEFFSATKDLTKNNSSLSDAEKCLAVLADAVSLEKNSKTSNHID